MALKRNKKGQFLKGVSGNPKGRPNRTQELGVAYFEARLAQVDPTTEVEVRERFRILNEVFGLFEVLHSQEHVPDFILRTNSGKVIGAECEIVSKHFRSHRHDPKKCDLIICWRHNWKESPLPIFPIAHLWFAYKGMKDAGLLLGQPILGIDRFDGENAVK